jgi:transposase-like protein
MATLQKYNATVAVERILRYFSEDFKRKKVREIEQGLTSVTQISREYQVTRAAIYKWIHKFSAMRKKAVKQVIEAKSDTGKIAQLRQQVQEMERMVGKKQIMIDFLEKMIELAEKEYAIDIKKKFSSTPSSGSGPIGRRTKSK